MAKAYVKIRNLPGAPAPTTEKRVTLNEDTEMLLLKRASGRGRRKRLGELSEEAGLSSDYGYKGEGWDKERAGSAQEEHGL